MEPRLVADRYQLGDILHQGESTIVFHGLDVNLRRPVVVKVMSRQSAGNREAVQRFLEAARSMSALSHPNIVAVYDVGILGDTPYAVSEFVEGKNLLDVIAEEAPLRADRVRHLGAQLASAIAYAQRYYGRDCTVDIADVMVASGDRIRVLRVHVDDAARHTVAAQFPAHDGSSGNDPSRSADPPRSSVYILGTILYQMSTGRAPGDKRLLAAPHALNSHNAYVPPLIHKSYRFSRARAHHPGRT